eukprot:SAG25_NODE_2542_length_1541_cov_1.040915_2_plen_86_part_01
MTLTIVLSANDHGDSGGPRMSLFRSSQCSMLANALTSDVLEQGLGPVHRLATGTVFFGMKPAPSQSFSSAYPNCFAASCSVMFNVI